MASKPLSQKEIAEKLGISSATVSLVLRDPDTNRASAETKQRIFQYAPATRRRPRNGSNQSKDTKATTVLFVMRGDHKRFFFQQSMLHGAQEQAAKLNLKLEVVNSHQDFTDLLSADYIRGVLLESPTLAVSDSIHQLANAFRTVTLNAHYLGDSLGMAILDDPFGGFRQGLEYALSLGHRRVGYLGFHAIPGFEDPRFLQRQVAFVDVCKFMGIELHEDAVQTIPSNANEEIDRSPEISAILQRWQGSESCPSLVFCHNDLLAARVIMVGLANGIRVPEHLSLIGYDNESLCNMLTPRLSSICPKFADMGRIAVSNLCDSPIWDSTGAPCRVIVPASLEIRDSAIAHSAD